MSALRVSVRASLVTTGSRRARFDCGNMCGKVQNLALASFGSVLHSLLNVCLHIRGKASLRELAQFDKIAAPFAHESP